jgi:hypothetical protein
MINGHYCFISFLSCNLIGDDKACVISGIIIIIEFFSLKT